MNGNFTAIPKEMLDDNRISALDLVIYAALDYFSDSGGTAWPGISILAKKAHVSVSTVKRSLPRLEKAGYITRERRYRSGTQELDTTLYRLAFRQSNNDENEVRNGSDGTGAGSIGYDRPVPSDTEVVSERARNENHITITNKQEKAGDAS